MTISIFDLFSIGIGPSSSHTVGPMRGALAFLEACEKQGYFEDISQLQIELYGSLALTGEGHGTDNAILSALEGFSPAQVAPESIQPRADKIRKTHQINLLGRKTIAFHYEKDCIFHRNEFLPLHSNGLKFSAWDKKKKCLKETIYYSIGGGFIVTAEDYDKPKTTPPVPYPFESGEALLALCEKEKKSIAEIMLANEKALHPTESVEKKLLQIAKTMQDCIEKGCQTSGTLPGILKVTRRAPELSKKLKENTTSDEIAWLNVFAISVNEENAAGGRIVTAPTNGAAGVIPAVLNYYLTFIPNASELGIIQFLLTAGAIALLCKRNASISGAEVGCQGEVGSASSMAAAGLTAVLGGTAEQIENAAEIAMEHHLGMTCDPIAGLVQIPCIERNAMGAVKALNAAKLALLGNGKHHVSLDKVIATMRQTGKDMMTIYKETSLGGLAANVPEC